MIKRYVKQVKRFVAALMTALMCLSFAGCAVSCSESGIVFTYTKAEDYGVFFESKTLVFDDRLLFFPKNLDNIKVLNTYKYLDGYYGLWAGNQVYLDVTYDEETFVKEIERWSNYKYDYLGIEENSPKFDNAYLFHYPTYVFLYRSKEYQYISIIEQECRVIYVYIEAGAKELIPDEHLPKNYYKNVYGEFEEKDGYYFSVRSSSSQITWYE